ncbi:hypothetical protein DFP72DRAFT_829979 [Ephemerocybe angulata]|uniref:Uncharacterized protein n=1 Tax=Ephemerocybe angulata TaxID=980116 RepID=A0A8H6LVJ6_9AGAR|nr:hypothetical protein DFP72DRAFT_829979 [Tulosesus angulatus]
MVAFSVTNKENLHNCKRTVRSRVENLLSTFGLDYGETMKAMREHNAIISGSSALTVLFTDGFQPGDVDFYVGREGMAGFLAWLEANTEYRTVIRNTLVDPNDWYSPGRHGIHDVKWLEDNATGMKMNVVTTQDPCPVSVIFQFYTTLSMNVISWAGVGCAYPSLTTKRLGVLVGKELKENTRVQGRVKKATERGFTIASSWDEDMVVKALGPHECDSGRVCPRGVRNLRSNRGLLWMTLDRWEEGEMQRVMPNVSWMMMDGRTCGDEIAPVRRSTRAQRAREQDV